LLVTFAADRLRKLPSQMEVEDIGVPLILAFLNHIEQVRGNTARSRNARLAAIRSFFRFLEYRVPARLDQSLRIRAYPTEKLDSLAAGDAPSLRPGKFRPPDKLIAMLKQTRSS
jgi:integrase/recombinase XerD